MQEAFGRISNRLKNTRTIAYTYITGIFRNRRELIWGSYGNQVVLQLLWCKGLDGVLGIGIRLKREEICKETGNVRASHRSAGNSLDGIRAASPGGLDVESRCEDINTLAIVGEIGTLIGQSGSSDSDSFSGGSRRVVACISIIITGSDGKMETRL